LAVNTRDWTFTSEISAMPGTLEKTTIPVIVAFFVMILQKENKKVETLYEIRN